jgi:two-component system chemotaxis response regulator CheY
MALKRVLICDDAKIMRLLMRNLLEKTRLFEIAGEATNGEECVQMFRDLKPDLLTLDLTMPKKDGVTAAQEILETHPDANIVVCTSAAQKFKMKQLEAMGVKNFVIKPFQPEKFLNVVTKACGLT